VVISLLDNVEDPDGGDMVGVDWNLAYSEEALLFISDLSSSLKTD
jgi:hypothetical protein